MIKPLEYHKPASVDEAAKLLAKGGSALAGGMTLLPALKQRLAAPPALVDLRAIGGLAEISADKKALQIGAMARHAQVVASADVQKHAPALAALAGGIGDAQVRHCGTIGGSLANNDPAADYPAALLALGGEVQTNKRVLAADEFFAGLFATALQEGELITQIRIPLPVAAAGYVKFRQPASLYALVGVFVAKGEDGARVAVTGAGNDGVFRASELEERLNKDFSAAALEGASVSAENLLSDIHGSAEYRAALIVSLARRALAAA